MAILLPALGNARDQGRTIACRSNLKQYGIGLRMYLDDNNRGSANLVFVDGHAESLKQVTDMDEGFRLAWPKKHLPY